jgi:hypothetical protein
MGFSFEGKMQVNRELYFSEPLKIKLRASQNTNSGID